jgi:PQQ-like domain
MRNTLRCCAVLLYLTSAITLGAQTHTASRRPTAQVRLLDTARLPGSFVTSQSIYADSERIFLCSYQGDLFVLARDRSEDFPLIQTVHLNSPLTSVRGDDNKVYVTSRDGTLYVFDKAWPTIHQTAAFTLSNYGLAALEVVGGHVYAAKGQAAMAGSESNLYIWEANPGDTGLDLTAQRSFGEQYIPNQTMVLDRQTLQQTGQIPHSTSGPVNINASKSFVYLTTPGCCGSGIDIYDAVTLNHLQFIARPSNVVAPARKRGTDFLVAGTEGGSVDLYSLNDDEYNPVNTVDLRIATGFTGPEDIEIRSIWVDGLDNLIIAASSWGNDSTRSSNLPSVFILELQLGNLHGM